ncbi:MAG: TOBE domain-containing protein [Anaerolineales bacterium]|nr:MAG: TOBE domain-containing protein [Anaerolineales bacterium]
MYTSPRTNFVSTFIGTATQFSGRLESRDTGRVTCGDFVLTVGPDLDPTFKSGDRVIVFVRPEAIHIAQPGEQIRADNLLTATLQAVTLLGPVIRLTLTSNGLDLVADVNTNERSRFARGETFLVYFPAEACRVMPDNQV